MPHATRDGPSADVDEAGAIERFLSEGGLVPNGAGHEGPIDQTDKADDAIDYENISDDDDLPEEEEGTGQVHDDDDDNGLNGFFGNRVPSGLNGVAQHPTSDDQSNRDDHAGDLFADGDEVNDLFGERFSSPEAERQLQPGNGQRPGLALPSKSALALPGQSGMQNGPKQSRPSLSTSPVPFDEAEYGRRSPSERSVLDDDDSLDANLALQRRLFRDSKRRNAGEDVEADSVETDMDLFHTLYSGYERTQAPRFTELFPPRIAFYKGKAPLKPPRPVQPTKLSLDLAFDQERSFRSIATNNKLAHDSTFNNSIVHMRATNAEDEESDDGLGIDGFDDDERIGNVTMQDLSLICQDWDVVSYESGSEHDTVVADYDEASAQRPTKKRRLDLLNSDFAVFQREAPISFEEPERAVAKVARAVILDLNDLHLLIDEQAQRPKKKVQRLDGDGKRDSALSRDLAKRYNISNDQAYDLLKENHQHKIRSTLGSMAVEHSLPATKLQYPFYKVSLDSKAKRSFHRPQLELKSNISREYRFQRPKHIKKKNWRGREAKDIYAKAEDLSLGDNASAMLLEYSEEAPMMMSNFGMGSRLINYYRKKNADDQERPKRDIGETHVLLTQDKSPFANFGHVDGGEIVPTIQNGMYRAPIYQHDAKPMDFLINISSTYESGDRFYIRNVENLHTVGQQFPIMEIPGQQSRKVTDAAKKRLRALSYRIHTKSQTRKDKVLNNYTLMPHLPGHDMPQTRSKMREFMKYERPSNKSEAAGIWVPKPGDIVPDEETMRGWIRPEDVCLLDSMQVGVQHLADLGITEGKDGDEDKDIEDGPGTNLEQQLAPWRATKNFINATQGKAMLKIYGEGDPTGRNQGFSFVKTSMKGGFVPQGESVADKLDARRRKEKGGHSYNVANQQEMYDNAIRQVWDAQKASLQSNLEASDHEIEDDPENMPPTSGRAATPRSSILGGTPGPFGRHDDDMTSQFSGQSNARGAQIMVITRVGRDAYGEHKEFVETVTNPRVIALYKKRVYERRTAAQRLDELAPTGDPELDEHNRRALEAELVRIKRNAERREHREKLKRRQTGEGLSAADSPAALSDAEGGGTGAGSVDGTPQKGGKGRPKDGTQRKCANCGQVGHIKTNRKLCPMLNGTMKPEDLNANGDSSFGAVPAPLTL